MAAKFQYNTEELRQRAVKALRGGTAPSWRALSGVLGVPEATLKYHLQHVLRIGSLAELATSVGAMPDARKMPVYEDPKKADRIDQESDGAALEISSVSVSGQIRTEDELVRACKIDLDERVITAGEHRKWDVTLKLRRGKHEIMRIVPQFYVRLRWLPKHPQPIEPVISPIELAIKLPKPRQTKRVELRRALVLADAQVGFRRRVQTGELTPFHDRRVLDLALQVLQAERFDAVLLIGDCLDMSEWSLKYVAEPEFYWTTQPALIEWAW